MCDKAVDTCPFVLHSVLGQCKAQEISDKVIFKKHFTLKYCLDRYRI